MYMYSRIVEPINCQSFLKYILPGKFISRLILSLQQLDDLGHSLHPDPGDLPHPVLGDGLKLRGRDKGLRVELHPEHGINILSKLQKKNRHLCLKMLK